MPLSRLEKLELLALDEERKRRRARNRLPSYQPYPKQRDFHAAGLTHRERLLMAGNQLGKTTAGACEVAYHLTGLYPDWWQGRRFNEPTEWWVAGETQDTTRDSVQRLLIGPPAKREEWGTGWLPGDTILKVPQLQGGTPDAIDTVLVKHVSGGISELGFKSYGRGRAKWQARTLHGTWMDEEPPIDVYTEALTRTNSYGGLLIITFTPLLGLSDVVRTFLEDPSAMVGAQLNELMGAR